MAVFKLSENFKSFLDDEGNVSEFYLQFPSGYNSNLSNLQLMGISQGVVSDSFKNLLAVFFHDRNFYEPNFYDPRWLLTIMESIQNSYDHGLAYEQGLKTELYVGNFAVGFGISDGGTFYNNSRVKMLIDNKELPSREEFPSIYKSNSSKNFSLNQFKGRHGFERLYAYSDFLEVDTLEGVFFMGFTKERLFRR